MYEEKSHIVKSDKVVLLYFPSHISREKCAFRVWRRKPCVRTKAGCVWMQPTYESGIEEKIVLLRK